MASYTEVGSQLSSPMAFVFVFNLLLGAGALALPQAFAQAGWSSSTILLAVLGFASFISASFMCEGMAIANMLQNMNCTKKNDADDTSPLMGSRLDHPRPDNNTSARRLTDTHQTYGQEDITYAQDLPKSLQNHEESGPSQSLGLASASATSLGGGKYSFRITQRIEMSEMAEIFFNKVGVIVFYICVIIYLYGDLAIYTVAVPKSLVNVTCYRDLEVDGVRYCWKGVSHDLAYRLYVLIYVLAIGSFVFFDAQKTTALQIFSSILRHTSFFIMIVIALNYIAKGEGAKKSEVTPFNIDKVPDFIGVSVYCFMCQHSLPSFITPMKNQAKATIVLGLALLSCFIIYILVCYTATFGYGPDRLEDVYTLNFENFKIAPIRYFLELYPVFCLTASYPIIGITLRNNLKTLFDRSEGFHWMVDRIVFPLLTIIPPTIIGLLTQNVESLVTYTGAFSGAAIQYVIPACFIILGRRKISAVFGQDGSTINKNHSIFSSNAWPIALLIWSALCMGFVLFNKIKLLV